MLRKITSALGALFLTACGPPTDDVMVQRFHRQREAFEKLQTEACPLRLWQHINTRGLADPEMDEALKKRLLTAMQKLGVNDLVVQEASPSCSLQLGVWSAGFAGTPATYKNFRYTSARLPETP
jgi:hypothetical protein